MEEKVMYRGLMEKVHAMSRAGKKPHGLMRDLAIDEVLDALHELQTEARSMTLDEEVRA